MKIRITTLIMALATILAIGSTSAYASEPEKSPVTKASYDLSDLKRNVGKGYILATNEQSEKMTFKVSVDKTGEVTDLTYSHNITSLKSDKLDAAIQKAYMAIMSTEFQPAKKDGQNVADTVTIEFQLLN